LDLLLELVHLCANLLGLTLSRLSLLALFGEVLENRC
jgi:hypothetical protein